MKIKQDDTVLVITGKDRGKRGRVREVHPADNKIVIEGVNIVKKHTKGRSGARQAGVIEQEAPMYAGKVMVVCPNCDHGARIGHAYLPNGQKVRLCHHCGELFDRDASQEKWGGRR
ncbi:MAG: 50S ribosomal protein L24 [Chloroflexi bacterium]|nr:50S ribosomal protein L24 [Chloroflexota bacterium]